MNVNAGHWCSAVSSLFICLFAFETQSYLVLKSSVYLRMALNFRSSFLLNVGTAGVYPFMRF